jgi:flagellar biosynthesis/type III secretory pathway ATPase
VFAAMARLLERAGQLENIPGRPAQGSITGLFTILVEGDETTEPVSDAARGILDGHLMLSRQLAQKNHYPAIDVLDSVSRVASDVSDPEHDQARRQLGRLMAAYRDIEDLVQIGAYAKGSSAEADVAIAFYPRIREILQQGNREREAWPNARARAIKVAAEAMAALNAQQRKQG